MQSFTLYRSLVYRLVKYVDGPILQHVCFFFIVLMFLNILQKKHQRTSSAFQKIPHLGELNSWW